MNLLWHGHGFNIGFNIVHHPLNLFIQNWLYCRFLYVNKHFFYLLFDLDLLWEQSHLFNNIFKSVANQKSIFRF